MCLIINSFNFKMKVNNNLNVISKILLRSFFFIFFSFFFCQMNGGPLNKNKIFNIFINYLKLHNLILLNKINNKKWDFEIRRKYVTFFNFIHPRI